MKMLPEASRLSSPCRPAAGKRCGANWAAFLLCQAIAVMRWRRDAIWLAIVAGVRLSDIFTDVTYQLVARDTTLFARLTLIPMSVGNLLFGLYLIGAYRSRVARSDSVRL